MNSQQNEAEISTQFAIDRRWALKLSFTKRPVKLDRYRAQCAASCKLPAPTHTQCRQNVQQKLKYYKAINYTATERTSRKEQIDGECLLVKNRGLLSFLGCLSHLTNKRDTARGKDNGMPCEWHTQASQSH